MILNWKNSLLLSLSAIVYFFVFYQIDRSEWYFLFPAIFILFSAYFFIIYNKNKRELIEIKQSLFKNYPILWIAILLRLISLFAMPTLSDDFYRFLWDGNLLLNDINPYLYLPSDLYSSPPAFFNNFHRDLFYAMNSPNYYSVYPAVIQYVFSLVAFFANNSLLHSIIIFRCIILLFEIGIFIILSKILEELNLSRKSVLIYALNPLIIIELVGNLHFESILIFFVLLSIFLIQKSKYFLAAIAFSLAVCTKFIPLLFLPLILRYIGLKRSIPFLILLFISSVLLFLPFLSNQLVDHIGSSVGLFIKTFEFNGSIYSVVKELGILIMGYNTIAIHGPVLAVVSLSLILYISFKSKLKDFRSLLTLLLIIITVYYFLAAVVHPWYISMLVVLVVFNQGIKYPLIWSMLVFISYFTYRSTQNEELVWLTLLAYIPVFYFFYRAFVESNILAVAGGRRNDEKEKF